MPDPIRPASGNWAGIVLAAGGSSRLGRSKQLLEWDGRPLVVRAAAALLEAELWPVVVVIGADADAVRAAVARLPVLAIENAAWPEGMASSIRTGVAAVEQFSRRIEGVLLALCDQPAFDAKAVRRLREAATQSGKSIAAAHYGAGPGAPAWFARRHFAALRALTGDQGARALLQAAGDEVAAVELPELAADVDTPADLAQLKRSLPR